MLRVYKSTLNRANGATANAPPAVHEPFTLTREPASVTFTPTYIEVLPNDRQRVVSAQITVFLEEVEDV